MNDALMIGVVLTLVFGAVIFYLYNRLMMTEKKMSLFGGVLTDLKIMMDSVPFASGPPPAHMHEFEPSPEYLNAISGPGPLQSDEIDGMDAEQETNSYQQTLEQALESASAMEASESLESKTLHIDEGHSEGNTLAPAINVTKLSPDLEAMTVKELNGLAKQKGVSVPAGTRRKELIEMLKNAPTMLDGPVNANEGAPLDGSLPEVTL